MAVYFKSCGRCQGDLVDDSDMYGKYRHCVQCGNYLTNNEATADQTPTDITREVTSKPNLTVLRSDEPIKSLDDLSGVSGADSPLVTGTNGHNGKHNNPKPL
tara:strand:+ start:42746 stop:43051 length:306 start_codon:yes stop_codon:yes gene_type:complete